jgi:dTDP-D-glucose 4,6-dehydratase
MIKETIDWAPDEDLETGITKTYDWILSKSDLDVICDYDTFKDNFINLCYDKYLK